MNEAVHASNVVALERADCAHPRTRVDILPPGNCHYGRVVCTDCGKQLCWQPHPRNIELRQRNAINLRKLLNSGRLTEWENGFCYGITNQARISPKQQAVLNTLTEKYLKQGDKLNDSGKRNGAPR
jgi:hypothetical protein